MALAGRKPHQDNNTYKTIHLTYLVFVLLAELPQGQEAVVHRQGLPRVQRLQDALCWVGKKKCVKFCCSGCGHYIYMCLPSVGLGKKKVCEFCCSGCGHYIYVLALCLFLKKVCEFCSGVRCVGVVIICMGWWGMRMGMVWV